MTTIKRYDRLSNSITKQFQITKMPKFSKSSQTQIYTTIHLRDWEDPLNTCYKRAIISGL